MCHGHNQGKNRHQRGSDLPKHTCHLWECRTWKRLLQEWLLLWLGTETAQVFHCLWTVLNWADNYKKGEYFFKIPALFIYIYIFICYLLCTFVEYFLVYICDDPTEDTKYGCCHWSKQILSCWHFIIFFFATTVCVEFIADKILDCWCKYYMFLKYQGSCKLY